MQGATVQYGTPANYSFNSLPDDFTVSITTAANSITLVFNDLTSDPTSDTQGISGLAFVLSGSIAGAPTISSASGELETIATGGTWTQDTVDSITHWATSNAGINSNSTTIYMSVFSGGTPKDVIIGNPDTNNVYSVANGSIAGSTHNPFIKETATFVLSLAGVTSSTQVSSATFNFGTMQGLCVGGTSNQCVSALVQVPEPGTSGLFLLALAAIGFRGARKRLKQAA